MNAHQAGTTEKGVSYKSWKEGYQDRQNKKMP
jgi:hypothetical protein